MMEAPYYIYYSPTRMMIHKTVTSKYFDLAISAVIGLNVITMAMEFYMMPTVYNNLNSKLTQKRTGLT
jgi:voltage-dependent calcium channel T type alpha-1G